MRGIEQENICRIQWDDCPRQQFPNNFPRFPHVLIPFVLLNLNVGLGLAILTSEVNGNPTYLENYTNWYSKYTTLEASGLCGPVLSCYEVASQSACSDSDYCYLDGSYTPNGKRLCCYADMGKSSKSCFDVYGFENADALVYDTSLKRIVGGTMFSQASVNDVDWSHWTNQADGMRRWYTFDFTTDSCEIDTSKSTFHSYHCQLGYWTDEYISEGDGMCYKYPIMYKPVLVIQLNAKTDITFSITVVMTDCYASHVQKLMWILHQVVATRVQVQVVGIKLRAMPRQTMIIVIKPAIFIMMPIVNIRIKKNPRFRGFFRALGCRRWHRP